MSEFPSISSLVKQFELNAKKSLGQNFIYDLNITQKIANFANPVPKDGLIVEIGPGPGGLTRSILSQYSNNVIAIEHDARFMPILQQLQDFYPQRMTILNNDALQYKLKSLKSDKIVIIANLPYNIATKFLTNWLQERQYIFSMVLMFQKEVAQRIVAKPNTKSYGSISVITQLQFDVAIAFTLSEKIFYPPPKIQSAVIKFCKKPIQYDDKLWEAIQKILRISFMHRRKLLHKNLSCIFENPQQVLENHSIPINVRAENLFPPQFVQLAEEYLRCLK